MNTPARLMLALLWLLLSACQASPVPLADPELPSPAGIQSPQVVGVPLNATLTLTPFQPVSQTATPSLLPSATPSVTAFATASATASPTPTELPEITLLFTGVIVPARCVQAAIDARGNVDYLYDEVRDILQEADLAVGTFNATMSDYAPRTGCIFTYVLVGGSENADALARAGFDVMSVATNHIKNCGIGDCGNRAFFDTLDNLRRVGILPVGAGKNLADAMQPVVVTIKGVRFGIVSLGQIEELSYAGEDAPGIAVLNNENLTAAIQAARQVSDVVIAMPHWGPEDVPDPNYFQTRFARVAVDAGADLVVGNHTHVVQAIQQIEGIDVFYGLGNFVFDQTWDLAHQQGVILLVKFKGSRYMGYELVPTHVDGDGTVHLAAGDEAASILARIRQASEALK